MVQVKQIKDLDKQTLLSRYYRHEHTFNEYPHIGTWSENFGADDLVRAIKKLEPQAIPHLLYVHIPFCRRQCLFCLCYTHITQAYAPIRDYLENLFGEISLYRDFLERHGIDPKIQELHIGGGSPTLLRREDFDRLMTHIDTLAPLDGMQEVALEIDPRTTTKQRLLEYIAQGVTRLSFGVQDLDPKVQRAIGRIQPPETLTQLLTQDVRQSLTGINFDLLCGLPQQTAASFRRTIDRTLRFQPERIMLMFLNYNPQRFPHQQGMDATSIPGLSEKLDLYAEAAESLLKAGYLRIGVDHFALPGDELVLAQQEQTLRWNSLGYRTGRCLGMIGLGAGILGNIGDRVYYRNTDDLMTYRQRIAAGDFPVCQGHELKRDEEMRRTVIHELRSYLSLDTQAISDRFEIDFGIKFKQELNHLAECQRDGLVTWEDRILYITEAGLPFQAHILGLFDLHLNTSTHKVSSVQIVGSPSHSSPMVLAGSGG